MRAYIKLFFRLLVPLGGVFIVASVLYFRIEYNFIKAFRLGVLSGFFIAIVVSFFTVLFLLIMRRDKQPQKSTLKKKKKVHSEATQVPKKETPTADEKGNTSTSTPMTKKTVLATDEKTIEQKMILLMDKELALEVLLSAISEQHIGVLTSDSNNDTQMTVKNDNELLQLSISTLTRHTSQVVITSEINSKAAKKIIHYMKEKEHSFLQY